ncbi:MAG: NAD(P)H-hydrate dehydratase [Ruminococcaceae bacterium]|nr:NAD(P)H-hydrate dehydratase [Oscillospiraceae bacterium]
MQYVVTNAQMKAAEIACDRESISFIRMMENAGIACAEEIIKLVPKGGYISILCGSGNNGGDGFVISHVLASHGISSAVILVDGEPKSECARHHFSRLYGAKILNWNEHREVCCDQIVRSDVVVDCIFGTGFHGTLPENAAAAIRYANNCPIRVAVDVPSGIDSDTGEMDTGYFRATTTLIIAAIKKGLLALPCYDKIGDTVLLDIGIDESCYGEDYVAMITDDSFRRPFKVRERSSHKGSYGKLMNIAGSLNYNGAAALSTKAALRTGVGLCVLATPRSVVSAVAATMHETTYLPLPEDGDGFVGDAASKVLANLERVTAVSIGSGLGNNENTRELTNSVIRSATCPIIIDADGINSIASNIDILKERKSEIILTPHVMEFSRISGLSIEEIKTDRIGIAKEFSQKYGVTLVLKGANTVIACPDGRMYINTCGNSGLAKGGSGDVLTGIIASMVAQGVEAGRAAACGVYCHALASDMLLKKLPMESMLPSDIIDILPEVYRS